MSSAPAMRRPDETGVPDPFPYMHPLMKKNYGAWAWHDRPRPGVLHHVAKSGDEIVGGIFDIAAPQFAQVPESWMAYIAVDDVDARVKKAQSAGAKLMKPIFDVPGVGRIAVLMEPGGAGIGWMTPAAT